ncbi:MAG TPA: toast rack family protein [Anaerolineaceae bacterium]|jgi:N-terminal domain of toast_rack, DUF2154
MNNRRLIPVVIVLMLAMLACTFNFNFPSLQTTETKTLTLHEPLPKGLDIARVSLSIPAGTLSLKGGATGLLEGTISYNVKDWDPVITRDSGVVSIKQGDVNKINGVPTQEMVNDWSLNLPNSVPLVLTINAGAYKGVLDLGGLPLKSLAIIDGASQSKVNFSQPNPIQLETFTYKTGASQVDMEGLANANFTNLRFDGGAGDYTFDFSGSLYRDAVIAIKAGVSNITLNIPVGTHVIIDNHGAISNINTEGTWVVNGSTYEASGNGPVITVSIDIAVGNLKLVRK